MSLSDSIHRLISDNEPGTAILMTDYLVVGSGYGGSVAALRLASAGQDVTMLERGREYAAGDFPYDESDIPSHVRLVRNRSDSQGYSDALFNIYTGNETDVLVGSGLGGTSLINANVAERPRDKVFDNWPQEYRNPRVLDDAYQAVDKHLSIGPSQGSDDLGKYQALKKLNAALDKQWHTKSEVRPANIAVQYESGPNNAGVHQNACTECGNCVTGCNVGAKGTLDRNLIPLAVSRGLEVYTNVTVTDLKREPDETHSWVVSVKATVQTPGSIRDEIYVIRAKNVILAAGTLGTNEILLRSARLGHLDFSKRLGEKFSTNGDGLVMSYGHESKVGALADAEQKSPPQKVGPTINGITETETLKTFSSSTNLTIEDAAIPAGITRFFNEAVISSAMLQRLGNRKLPAYIADNKIDPIAASGRGAEHSQALLIMGEDGSEGKLKLDDPDDPMGSTVNIDFPNVHHNQALTSANYIIKKEDRCTGLDGAQYVPNPLWQLLPADAANVMDGELPGGRAVTVHPLGGCAMGDDIDSGVVNASCQVYKSGAGKTDTYDGLYVMDGSVLPTAIGINPFMTISALAWHNAGKLVETSDSDEPALARFAEAWDVPERPQRADKLVRFTVREQLVGPLSNILPSLQAHPHAIRLTQKDGLVLYVEAEIPDTDAWLDQSVPFCATAKIYANPWSEDEVNKLFPYGVKPDLLTDEHLVAELSGGFHFLPEDDFTWWTDVSGGVSAICAYFRKREPCTRFLKILASGLLKQRKPQIDRRPVWAKLKDKILKYPRYAVTFWNVAVMQSRYRRMVYKFSSDELELAGEKIPAEPRLWPALLNLESTITDKASGETASAVLEVNADFLLDAGLLKLRQAPSLPSGAFAAMSIGGLFARSIFATNFWEFGGAPYPDEAVQQQTDPIPIPANGTTISPQLTKLATPLRRDDNTTYDLLMIRYENPGKPPALLLHGLAQGSQIYWTDTLDKNLASYLYEAGYDVWLADFRLTNHDVGLPDLDWTMDEIAEFDIPAMVNHVTGVTGQSTYIFAHCVGACTTAMSVLAGYLDTEKIAGAAFNAIHPWTITSPANKVRSKIGSFYRDWIKTSYLDPIPSPNDGAFQNALDRGAYAISKIEELEMDDHLEYGADELTSAICDRMTILYGRMWNHKSLDPRTHAAFKDMFGPAPSRVYQHLYYYSLQSRITNQHGDNAYLTRANLQRWKFRTIFLHGRDSRVFNPYSAELSAYNLAEFSGVKSDFEIFDDYGHMDVVFAKDADKRVYGIVDAFFRDTRTPNTPWVHKPDTDAMPNIGPVLRAAWRDGDDLKLRYWGELNRNTTVEQKGLTSEGVGVSNSSDIAIDTPSGGSRHRLLDVTAKGSPETLEFSLKALIRDESQPGINLQYGAEGWYRNLTGRGNDGFSFLVGSCRFPGTIIDNDKSDAIFGEMQNHLDSANHLFLIGDQIYADATDELFQVDSLRSKFRFRYENAFHAKTSPNFAALTRQIPTHFALDDHEWEDGWSGLPPVSTATTTQEIRQLDAITGIGSHGLENSRRFQSSGRDQIPVGGTKSVSPFSYAVNYPGESAYPIYVIDTRSNRTYRGNGATAVPQLFSNADRDDLLAWLSDAHADHPDKPKFIVSGSIVAPVTNWFASNPDAWALQDSWAGYPGSMASVMKHIADNEIQKVVFVGGDEHLSAWAKLTVAHGDKSVTAWQIVASGLYSPMPFANSKGTDFTWDAPVTLPSQDSGLSVSYRASLLSEAQSQFTKVSVTDSRLVLAVYDDEGTELANAAVNL